MAYNNERLNIVTLGNSMDKKIKLLLVDDEQMIRENLAALLSRSGFEVVTAADGEEALERVEQITPDLIVMDVLMPRLDGRSAVRR